MIARRTRRRERGLTLLEMVIASGILSTVFLGVGALFSGSTAQTRTIRRDASIAQKALEIVDVCRSIPFGQVGDVKLDETRLIELFDADPQLGWTDGATLTAVANTAAAATGGAIVIPTSDTRYFPDGFIADGAFVVRITTTGGALMSRATADDPLFALRLKNGTVPTAAAIRVSVDFRYDGGRGERRMLQTVIVARDPEGVTP